MNYSELTKQISENILKSVKQIIDQKSDSDKSFKAQITSVVSNDKYTIKHCGKTYAAHSSIPCMVGNYVRVCAPCNNWSDLYIVENKSSRKILDDRLKEITNDISKVNENFNRLQNDVGGVVQRYIEHLKYVNAYTLKATVTLDRPYSSTFTYEVSAGILSQNSTGCFLSIIPLSGKQFEIYINKSDPEFTAASDVAVYWISVGSPLLS